VGIDKLERNPVACTFFDVHGKDIYCFKISIQAMPHKQD
jgi:hypothetical protein